MLDSFDALALEVADLPRAREFYARHLDADFELGDGEAAFDAGDTTVVLREPGPVPRGGVHVHYAFETPPDEYGDWLDRVSELDVDEHDFGSARSLYVFDPDDHCVEIGSVGPDSGTGLTGVFEVVLEVEDLARAESFYRDLDFSVMDRGTERRRVRLTGPVDLELWEPQLGIADARGGVHADLAFSGDVDAVRAAVSEDACSVESVEGGVRVRDPDGHYLTVS